MKIERGDSIKFGKKWCKAHKSNDLINKVVKLTPQWFEEDNGLYCYETECPGIWDEENQEADSIYHLFGNNLEDFMDCELIKGTKEDIAAYQKIIEDRADAEAKNWERMAAAMEHVEL